ncbi:hypothetical protein ACI2JA_03260 [Alkalihalobacillus sp. NPDC078783]
MNGDSLRASLVPNVKRNEAIKANGGAVLSQFREGIEDYIDYITEDGNWIGTTHTHRQGIDLMGSPNGKKFNKQFHVKTSTGAEIVDETNFIYVDDDGDRHVFEMDEVVKPLKGSLVDFGVIDEDED